MGGTDASGTNRETVDADAALCAARLYRRLASAHIDLGSGPPTNAWVTLAARADRLGDLAEWVHVSDPETAERRHAVISLRDFCEALAA